MVARYVFKRHNRGIGNCKQYYGYYDLYRNGNEFKRRDGNGFTNDNDGPWP